MERTRQFQSRQFHAVENRLENQQRGTCLVDVNLANRHRVTTPLRSA